MNSKSTIRIAAVGLNHGHIYGQVDLLLRAGAELVAFYAVEPDLAAQFSSRYPQARLARSVEEILEDRSIHMVVSAAIPDERGPLGIEVMRHEKDYMSDKPAFTTLEQLDQARQVQAETGRIFSICYSERLENPATVRAGELVKSGVIGTVVQTIGMGPHRANLPTRPAWFFQRERYGGTCAILLPTRWTNSSSSPAPHLPRWSAPRGQLQTSRISRPGRFRRSHAMRRERQRPPARGLVYPRRPGGWGDARLFILGTEGYWKCANTTTFKGAPAGITCFGWMEAEPIMKTALAATFPMGGSWCRTCSSAARPP